jgi:hypothetical protein
MGRFFRMQNSDFWDWGISGLKCKAAISKRSDLSLGLVILKTNAEL